MQLPRWNNCKNPRTRGKTAQPSISHSGQGLEGKKSSSLPVEGGIFSLTFPFIDQADDGASHPGAQDCSHYADSVEEGRKLRRDETKIASRLSVSGQEPSISGDLSGGGRWFLRRSGSRVSIPIACRRTSAAGT